MKIIPPVETTERIFCEGPTTKPRRTGMSRKWMVMVLVMCAAIIVLVDVAAAEIKTDYGAAFRARHEYWENLTDLNTRGQADRDFFRLRTSVWGKMDLNPNLGFYVKLTNEMKYFLGNFRPLLTSDSTSKDDRYDVDELLIDNLYFEAKNVLTLPLDLKIGRQDLRYGDGFLIADGTPGDGSRTFYFNAFKATYNFNKDNALDLIYISQPIKDEYLPSLYPSRSNALSGYVDNKKRLGASDEQAFVAYLKSKLLASLAVEPYYMYKEEDPVGANTQLQLNTLGMRAAFAQNNWKLRAEYAHQWGNYMDDARERSGNGGYIFAGYTFANSSLKPLVEIGYVYLSGDDSTTAKHEGWNPLFSRAPSWNELFIYTLIAETAGDGGPIPGYWTNLHLYVASVNLTITPATNLALSYQYLKADEATVGLNAAMFSNKDKERGHLGALILKHSFTKQIDGMLQLEYFAPGDFYADAADDAIFSRVQLMFKF